MLLSFSLSVCLLSLSKEHACAGASCRWHQRRLICKPELYQPCPSSCQQVWRKGLLTRGGFLPSDTWWWCCTEFMMLFLSSWSLQVFFAVFVIIIIILVIVLLNFSLFLSNFLTFLNQTLTFLKGIVNKGWAIWIIFFNYDKYPPIFKERTKDYIIANCPVL